MGTATIEQPTEGQVGPFGRVWHDGKWTQPARKAKATAPVQEALEGDVLDAPDDVFQQLVQLAQAAGGVAKKKQERGAILDQVADLLNKLDPQAYSELLEHPAVAKLTEQVVQAKVANNDVPPGADLGPAIGKKPWTARDLAPDRMDQATWTPRMSCPITYNGITLYVQEDVEITTPKCFKDIHDESRLRMRHAKEHIDYIMRKRDSVSDPTMLTDGSMRVRGRFSGGDARVSKGLDIEVPDTDRPGMDMAADEGEGGE